jgi:hypothetical protein
LLTSARFSIGIRLGDGIAYITKTFNRVSPVDTINVAVGSHLNDFIMLMAQASFQFSKHWQLLAGGQLWHISNGSNRKPNLGINTVGGHIGIGYFPGAALPEAWHSTTEKLKPRWLVQARLSMATVASYTAGGPRYPVYVASAYVSRRWRSVNKAFLGADYSYNSDVYSFLKTNNLEPGSEYAHSYKTAIFAGNEFLLGRVGIVVQVGAYLHQAYIKKDDVYEKAGLHYYIVSRETGPVKEVFFSLLLKTHLSVAEFGESGIGVGF